MIKLRGFGGPSRFWDENLESFTLMAGLAAVTERITLYASSAVLTLHPVLAARMAVTIDSIAPGRFGINIVTGWQEREFAQMGLWPGEAHYNRRYQYAAEYVQVMRELWADGVSNFQGDYFQLDDCRLLPRPRGTIGVVCVGQSDTGIEFCAPAWRRQLRGRPRRQHADCLRADQRPSARGRRTERARRSAPTC